jgi:hypothetical protein
MIPVPLVLAVVAIGGAYWYLKRRRTPTSTSSSSGSKLPPHIPSPGEFPGGPTPGEVPDTGVPTYAFDVVDDGSGKAQLVKRNLDLLESEDLFSHVDGLDPSKGWIVTNHLPVDVLVSLPDDFANAGVHVDKSNQLLSESNAQDVFVRVNNYSTSSFVNAPQDVPSSVLILAKKGGQGAGNVLSVYVAAKP